MPIYNFTKPGENGTITVMTKVKTLTSGDTIKVRAKVSSPVPENQMIKVKVIRVDEEDSKFRIPIKDGNSYRNRTARKNPNPGRFLTLIQVLLSLNNRY